MKNRRTFLSIVFLIGIIGVGNLAIGILSYIVLNSVNLPDRISAINSLISSFDPGLIQTLEIQASVSIIQNSVVEELNSFVNYSHMLNGLPVYFIVNGLLFVILSVALHYVILEETSST
jgi:hypothetical protein